MDTENQIPSVLLNQMLIKTSKIYKHVSWTGISALKAVQVGGGGDQ